MRFGVLGPVEIADEGRTLSVARRQARCVLAILLLEPGRTVSGTRLCELLWGDDPPENAQRLLRSHVSRIRAAITPRRDAGSQVALDADHSGYVLRVDPESVDVHRFRGQLAQALGAPDPAVRDHLLREALALWRGPALQDARAGRLVEGICADLDEQRFFATEEWISAGFALGRHRELQAEAGALAAAHPTRERLAELAMTALYRVGRTADALAVYQRTRTALVEQFGLDPGPALCRLHQTMLRREPLPDPVTSAPPAITAMGLAQRTPSPVRPAQLPRDPAGFVGRAEHLDRLRELLAEAGEPSLASSMAVIVGAAGVGKSTLAVHWGHQVRDRFPDGQLYVDLRGFDRSGSVVPAAEALRGFLDALGVPDQQVPADEPARAALYRSVLAEKRMLVLLDNAYDADQVRPLLPAGAGCVALITSRNQLSGLVARDGAALLALDVLTAGEARQMLAARLGAGRVRHEPGAVETVVEACGRLPLALAIVAARAAAAPQHPLTAVARELAESRGGLDAFSAGDPATDVRAVFSWSYRALTSPAARVFRLLSLHPDVAVTAAAAASLSGEEPREVCLHLAELVRTHLLAEPSSGCYTMHDLLRAYAGERALADDGDAERRSATHRLMDHYVHTAYAAALRVGTRPQPQVPGPPAPGVSAECLDDSTAARRWLTTHWPILVNVVEQAADGGLDRQVVALSSALSSFLARRDAWRECHEVDRVALAAAQRLGEPAGEAEAHRRVALAASALRQDDEAVSHVETALKLFGDCADETGLAHAHFSYSWVFYRQDRVDRAIEHAREAERLFRVTGDRLGQAIALNNIGWDHILLGEFRQALSACRRALAIQIELDDRLRQADTQDSLGHAHHCLGQLRQAHECYRGAIMIYREADDRPREARSLSRLADIYDDMGDGAAAYAARRRAVSIMEEVNHPDAEELRRRLVPTLVPARAS